MQQGKALDESAARGELPFHFLPVVPETWLQLALPRLNQRERELALREKIVAYGWMADDTVYAVVTAQALRRAQALGLTVEGRIAPEDFRLAVRRSFGLPLAAAATWGLASKVPQLSAHRRMTAVQAFAAGVVMAALLLGVAVAPDATLHVLHIVGLLFFLNIVGLRLLSLLPLPKVPGLVVAPVADENLPVYSVLVPLFRETAVLKQLLHALALLDYPHDKLDIKLILEESDRPLHEALSQIHLPPMFDIVVVPHGKPQTKPRALNFALQFARGDLITIFDAEDQPQPNQLRLAAARFAAAGGSLSCLQARLSFYNPAENWLTFQFSVEYAALFAVLLPSLAAYGLPLPLGGTSNHFRADALRAAGGWDAFNVTEDADIGLRLARLGHGVDVLDSTTFEEANVELGNWMRQRRRWLKGFLQTWLVHSRSPLGLLRELGPGGFMVMQAVTLGVFVSALLHPLLLMLTGWQAFRLVTAPAVAHPSLTHIVLVGASLAVLAAGYGLAMLVAVRGMRRVGLVPSLYIVGTIPAYWLLQSLAAWAALWDFMVKPFHWHKTRHGLSRMLKRPPQMSRGGH